MHVKDSSTYLWKELPAAIYWLNWFVSQSELLLPACHTATVLANLYDFFLFVLFGKMSFQTSPVCAVQDLSNVWAMCRQPLGEAEYSAEHHSVGVFCSGGGMGLVAVGCGRSHILLQWQNSRQGAGGDSELLLPFAYFCLHIPWEKDL